MARNGKKKNPVHQVGSKSQGRRYGDTPGTRKPVRRYNQNRTQGSVRASSDSRSSTSVPGQDSSNTDRQESRLLQWIAGFVTAFMSWSGWETISTTVRWDSWPAFAKSSITWLGISISITVYLLVVIFHKITSLNWWWSIGIVWVVLSYTLLWVLLEIPRSTWKIINLSFLGVLIFLKLFVGSDWDWVMAAFVALSVPYIMSGQFIFATVSRSDSISLEKADWISAWFKVMKQFPEAKWYHHFTVWLEYYWAVKYSYSPAGIHADSTWLAEILPGGFNPGGRTIAWDRVNEFRYRDVGVLFEWPSSGWLEIRASANESIFMFLIRNPREQLGVLSKYRFSLVDD